MDNRIYFKSRNAACNAAENLNYDYGCNTWIVDFDFGKSKWFVKNRVGA